MNHGWMNESMNKLVSQPGWCPEYIHRILSPCFFSFSWNIFPFPTYSFFTLPYSYPPFSSLPIHALSYSSCPYHSLLLLLRFLPNCNSQVNSEKVFPTSLSPLLSSSLLCLYQVGPPWFRRVSLVCVLHEDKLCPLCMSVIVVDISTWKVVSTWKVILCMFTKLAGILQKTCEYIRWTIWNYCS